MQPDSIDRPGIIKARRRPDGERSRRHREVRAKTLSMKRLSKWELELGRILNPPVEGAERPRTRGDCGSERPCPFVSCKYHLYLDVDARTGAIKSNFPDLEVWEMVETCTIDVAAREGESLERVGEAMNITRARIQQIEAPAKRAVHRALANVQGGELLEEPDGRRHLPVIADLDEPDLEFAETAMDLVPASFDGDEP
jgi:hypothetical protein